MEHIRDKQIAILGAARSGLAAAKMLTKLGANCFVSDNAPVESKVDEKNILDQESIEYEFGGHTDRIYQADFVVLSPGISKETPVVKKITQMKIPVYSELEVASWFSRSPIVAVTGSNGKTTTTTLLGLMIQAVMPKAAVAGNIGNPYSNYVLHEDPSAWTVLEISSFQLETIEKFHPRVAVLLNIAPNHLDWYKTYNDYIDAKMRILKNLTSADFLIYNLDDSVLVEKTMHTPAKKLTFSLHDSSASAYIKDEKIYLYDQPLIETVHIRLKGNHNIQNIMAAGLAAQISGVENKTICSILTSFAGVEHRLEYVNTINHVDFINDSKATTIESLAVALTSFFSPIILIAGGKDKGSDYTKLNELLVKHVRCAILIGSAKEKMNRAWQDLIPMHLVDDLSDAVKLAFSLTKPGDNVILSPACSSFDMFRDFEDRGRQFKEIVNNLKSQLVQ